MEDPESAELLNLLPGIVDSARSAAGVIATRTPREGWTDDERQLFGENLLVIVENADEFDRRLPTQPAA